MSASSSFLLSFFVCSGVELTTVDPFAPPVTQAQLDADFRAVIQAEKECIGNVKMMQRAITDLIRYRSRYVDCT